MDVLNNEVNEIFWQGKRNSSYDLLMLPTDRLSSTFLPARSQKHNTPSVKKESVKKSFALVQFFFSLLIKASDISGHKVIPHVLQVSCGQRNNTHTQLMCTRLQENTLTAINKTSRRAETDKISQALAAHLICFFMHV